MAEKSGPSLGGEFRFAPKEEPCQLGTDPWRTEKRAKKPRTFKGRVQKKGEDIDNVKKPLIRKAARLKKSYCDLENSNHRKTLQDSVDKGKRGMA